VLYAGSLQDLMNNALGPAFHRDTGYTLVGTAGGSDALASQIMGGTTTADVFVSASAEADRSLEGAASGGWASWYATFATSPLVIAYNPTSPFASQLKARPWYRVVTEPGFLLGRTDPATDPKGELAVEALDQASAAERLPALAQLTRTQSGVYPEETLVGLLQSGQLDAGFFYASEATAAGLPIIRLGAIHLEARYTVTVVNRDPHPTAAGAFVSFLLGRTGRAVMVHYGLSLVSPPTVSGAVHVPARLRPALRQS
jgi:molybdate/tungstate transport system substrate-binding protein